MEYLIYQGGASNKFHIFFVAQDDGGQYHAFNAYGRIGYNPRIQYIGGPYSTSDSAEYAFKKKMGQKTKKGYRPFGAETMKSISKIIEFDEKNPRPAGPSYVKSSRRLRHSVWMGNWLIQK